MKRSATSLSLGAKQKGFFQEAVHFVEKKVGAFQNKLEEEAHAIAVRSAVMGGLAGILVGITAFALWEKYMAPPTVQVQEPPKA